VRTVLGRPSLLLLDEPIDGLVEQRLENAPDFAETAIILDTHAGRTDHG